MVQQLRLCLIAFTFLGSATVAFAQNPAPGGKHEKLNLSQQQKQAIDQGLASEQAQSSAAAQQAQVGSKVPGSVATHPMPSSVTLDWSLRKPLTAPLRVSVSCSDWL